MDNNEVILRSPHTHRQESQEDWENSLWNDPQLSTGHHSTDLPEANIGHALEGSSMHSGTRQSVLQFLAWDD